MAILTPAPESAPMPVTFHLPITLWVAWITSIGLGLTGLALIGRFIIKASRIIADVTEYGSVIKQIAKEFKSDSGSTLKDAINRIEAAAMDAKATALAAQKMSENLSRLILTETRELESGDSGSGIRRKEQP